MGLSAIYVRSQVKEEKYLRDKLHVRKLSELPSDILSARGEKVRCEGSYVVQLKSRLMDVCILLPMKVSIKRCKISSGRFVEGLLSVLKLNTFTLLYVRNLLPYSLK